MARTLQLCWTDEPDRWRSVRELKSGENELDAIREARAQQDETDRKYPHHKFSAEFRVVDLSIFSRRLEIA
jgi:hypothetical protein